MALALPRWEYRYRGARSDKPRERGDDGDTVLMLLDRGMGDRGEESIRLAGVWAPEMSEFGGEEAAHLTDLVLDEVAERFTAAGLRWPFEVKTEPIRRSDEGERRSFTRYAGHLWARDTGEYLNATIAALIKAHPEWGGGIGAKAARDNG